MIKEKTEKFHFKIKFGNVCIKVLVLKQKIIMCIGSPTHSWADEGRRVGGGLATSRAGCHQRLPHG